MYLYIFTQAWSYTHTDTDTSAIMYESPLEGSEMIPQGDECHLS